MGDRKRDRERERETKREAKGEGRARERTCEHVNYIPYCYSLFLFLLLGLYDAEFMNL